MYQIGVYSKDNIFSPYIMSLKEYGLEHQLIELENGTLETSQLDVILLDYTEAHPSVPVGQICTQLISLKKKNCPVLVLLRQCLSEERLLYLKLGAALVVEKETTPEELSLIFLNSYLRSTSSEESKLKDILHLELDPLLLVIKLGKNKIIPLTPLEYKFIDCLNTNIGEVCTYEQIIKTIWGSKKNTKFYQVSNLIFHIRNKLKKYGVDPNLIRTVRSRGYSLSYFE